MENKIEYVLYENVKDNEYINKIKPIDDADKKIKRTDMYSRRQKYQRC